MSHQLEGNLLCCWLCFGLMFGGHSLLEVLWLYILIVSGGLGAALAIIISIKQSSLELILLCAICNVDTCSVSCMIAINRDITVWESEAVL